MTDYPPFTVAKPKPASGNPPDEETPPGADVVAPKRGRPRKANGPAPDDNDLLGTLSVIAEELARYAPEARKAIVEVLLNLIH